MRSLLLASLLTIAGHAVAEEPKLWTTFIRDKFDLVDLKTVDRGSNEVTFRLTFQNDHEAPVKDVEVSCDFSGPSGTTIETHRHTIFDVFPGKSKRKSVNVRFLMASDQVTSATCDVKSGILNGPRVEYKPKEYGNYDELVRKALEKPRPKQ